MKRFLLRLSIYVALVVGVIGGLCAWEIGAEICRYREEIVAPSQAAILVCGDSQMENAVDPSVCPVFFNFSASGRALDQDYMIMLDILRANPGRFNKVLVDVSPPAATWSLDKPLSEMSFSAGYWLVHYLHPRENMRDLNGGARVVRDNLVGRRLRHAWRALRGRLEFHSSLYGHFTPHPESNKRDCPPLYEGLLQQKADLTKGAADIADDALMFQVLAKMSAAARTAGAEPVLVTTPWNRELIGRCGEKELDRFTAKVEAWSKKRGIRYVNLLKEDFPDDCWMDANHLNVAGARLFTKRLQEAVR